MAASDTEPPNTQPRKRRLSNASDTPAPHRRPSPPHFAAQSQQALIADDVGEPTPKTSSRLLTALKSRRTTARRRLETANETLAAANEWLAKSNERVAAALKHRLKGAGGEEALGAAVQERPEAEEQFRKAEEESEGAMKEWVAADRMCRTFKAT